jgi:hypothetical protein
MCHRSFGHFPLMWRSSVDNMVCAMAAVGLIGLQEIRGKRNLHLDIGVLAALALVTTIILNTTYICQHPWLHRCDQDIDRDSVGQKSWSNCLPGIGSSSGLQSHNDIMASRVMGHRVAKMGITCGR